MIPPVPPLEDLQPFKAVAASIGLTTAIAHRWRRHPDTPFHAWKVAREWMTTEEAAAEFIRLRTERMARRREARFPSKAKAKAVAPAASRPTPAVPVLDKRLQRIHQAAKAANDQAGW